MNSLDNDTILSLELLYWSVLSPEHDTVSIYVDFLSTRNLLSQQINKGYPNASILAVAANSSQDNLNSLLECNELENSTLLHKFENQNAFECSLNHHESDFFTLLFSDPGRRDLFFKNYLGFLDNDCDDALLEKYKTWGGYFLFDVLKPPAVEAIELGVKLLKNYGCVLNYELSRLKSGVTILQCVVKNFWWCGGKLISLISKGHS